jgi:hypothetical protein
VQKEVAALRGQLTGASPAASPDGGDIEDHGADFDTLAEMDALNDEVTQRRSDEHLTTIGARYRQIAFLSRQLARCGKAAGEQDPDKIAPAVEAMARTGRVLV